MTLLHPHIPATAALDAFAFYGLKSGFFKKFFWMNWTFFKGISLGSMLAKS
jgi:hypothetical protein